MGGAPCRPLARSSMNRPTISGPIRATRSIVYREPQTFLAFGALGTQRQIPFQAWRISLAEASRQGRRPQRCPADPTSVFLYRGETRETVEAMGVDTSQFKGPIVPVIYNLNLKDPGGYFLHRLIGDAK